MKVMKLGGTCSGAKYLGILEKGEKIMESLKRFHKSIAGGSNFVTIEAIGACENIEIGYLEADGSYTYKKFEGEYEVLSCKGNITIMSKESIPHIHMTISNRDMNAFGGHLKEATVSATMECIIEVTAVTVNREFDEELGINLIKLKK